MNSDEAFKYWLKSVQGSDLGAREILNPARSNTPLGQIIKDAGGGLVFDTEPAGYYKRLRELKPGGDAS
ncbi:MAG: hypothetical protein WD075_15710 [Rhodospirillales bacterium]